MKAQLIWELDNGGFMMIRFSGSKEAFFNTIEDAMAHAEATMIPQQPKNWREYYAKRNPFSGN